MKKAAGTQADHLELNILIQMLKVTDDRRAEMDQPQEEHQMPNDEWFEPPMVYVGSVDEIVNRLQEVRERTGASYFVVFEPRMAGFAPIVEQLANQ